MDIRHITQVVTLAEEGSFSRAAERLFISQPALSQSIRGLEKELGIELFLRGARGVSLTAAGEIFVSTGYQVMSDVAALTHQMSAAAATQTRKLRLGISSFYGMHYLPRLVPIFRRRHPSVRLEIREEPSGELERLARDGIVDLAMVPFPLNESELAHEIIHDEQILLAVPRDHPITQRFPPGRAGRLATVPLEAARRESFIFLKPPQRFREMGVRRCREAGFEPTVIFESTNWDTINALVSSGLGVGFVPGILVDEIPANERPVYYRLEGGLGRPYAVVYPSRGPLSPIATSFIEVIREAFA